MPLKPNSFELVDLFFASVSGRGCNTALCFFGYSGLTSCGAYSFSRVRSVGLPSVIGAVGVFGCVVPSSVGNYPRRLVFRGSVSVSFWAGGESYAARRVSTARVTSIAQGVFSSRVFPAWVIQAHLPSMCFARVSYRSPLVPRLSQILPQKVSWNIFGTMPCWFCMRVILTVLYKTVLQECHRQEHLASVFSTFSYKGFCHNVLRARLTKVLQARFTDTRAFCTRMLPEHVVRERFLNHTSLLSSTPPQEKRQHKEGVPPPSLVRHA